MPHRKTVPLITYPAERAAIADAVQDFIDVVANRMRWAMGSDCSDEEITWYLRCFGAVVKGHCTGAPMIAADIAKRTHMPPNTVKRRLDKLVEHDIITSNGKHYYLGRRLATDTGPFDEYMAIFDKLFVALGPMLADYRARRRKQKKLAGGQVEKT